MDFLTFTFQSFWHFIGITIILGMVLNFILTMYTRLLRHFTIRKHGYPPENCDVDGDFKAKETE